MERIRSAKIECEVGTNKDTYRIEVELGEDESIVEFLVRFQWEVLARLGLKGDGDGASEDTSEV